MKQIVILKGKISLGGEKLFAAPDGVNTRRGL